MTEQKITETILSRAQVFDGAIIHVEHWQVRLPNGKTALREVAVHPGAAAVVAIDDSNRVAMVQQHRVAVGKVTWEIPAGKLDAAGEDPFVCAQRELSEETGLNAANWRLLTVLLTTPGFCNEKISIYLATGLTQRASHTDEDEFLNVKFMPFDEAISQVTSGAIQDSKTIAGLLLAEKAVTHVNE